MLPKQPKSKVQTNKGETARQGTLNQYGIIDTPPEDAFDRLARIAKNTFQTPIALISFIELERQWFKACFGLDRRETEREYSFCTYTFNDEKPFIVLDATQDDRFKDNPLVIGEPFIKSYIGAPIIAPNGQYLGALCVIDSQVREQPSQEQLDILTELSYVVVDELEMRKDAELLRETQKKLLAAENQSQIILESITDAFFSLDRNWQFLYLNQQAEQLLARSREELLGKSIWSEFPESVGSSFYTRYHEAVTSKQAVRFEAFYRPLRAWFEINAYPSEKGLSVYFQNINARKATEVAFEAAIEKAKRANQAKSDFLSRVSHELRTPLNSIMGFTQLMQLEDLTADQVENVDHVMAAGKHLLALVDELLDISKIEQEKISINLSSVNLKDLIQNSLTFVQADYEELGISVTIKGSIAYSVKADELRLKQVLLNLLSNAIAYNNPEGSINISTERKEQTLSISIQDTGSGIPEDKLANVFEPFARLDHNASKNPKGSGVGLALCKSLVTAMNGTISVESVLGQGSKFTITVPLIDKESSISEQTGQSKIVLIEDNIENANVIRKALKKLGLSNMKIAEEGQLGLDICLAELPHLILLDLNLPDLSGQEILKELKSVSTTKTIPVIVISADVVDSTVAEVRALGATAFIPKPINLKLLLEQVSKALWLN